MESLWMVFVISLGLSAVLANLNFNNDLEYNKKFESKPTTVKTCENDTVLLPCYPKESPVRYVRWHRDDKLLADSRHPGSPPPERVFLWPNGSLQVSHVQPVDTGEYYCEMMTVSNTHAVQTHAIEVQYPPSIVLSRTGVQEVPIRAIFEIICEAKGVPQPVISWRKNGIDLVNDKVGNRRVLTVEIKSREDSGTIECLATNGVGAPAVDTLHVNVLFAPEVKAVMPTVHTKISMRIHLECLVESAPTATVQWFHHGIPVTANSNINIHDNELQSNRSLTHYYTESKHMLIIKKVQDSDLGFYECRAENKIGFKGVQIELTGRPLPCSFKVNPGPQKPTSHMLIWQTESLSPISEYKLKFRQIPSGSGHSAPHSRAIDWTEFTIPAEISEGSIHTISYNLYGLQPASIYEVAALAKNRFGWSDNSKIIRFATGGDVELPNYSTESELMYSGEEDLYDGLTGNDIDQISSTQSSRGDYDYAAKFSSASSLSAPLFISSINKIFKILFA